MLQAVLFLSFLSWLLPVHTQATDTIPYPEGLSINYLTVNAAKRKYLVYRPARITTARAVVMVLHGGGGKGIGVAETGKHVLSVFRQVADTANFLVVYPEGSPDKLGNPGWNDCRGDDVAGSQGKDIDFLYQLNGKLRQELGLTPTSMFLTGGSNGAMMTFSYASIYPQTVRAIAAGSGNLPLHPESGPCTSGTAVPIAVLLTHGTADPAMPANGGCVANLGGACNRGKVVSQAATLEYWLRRNNLRTTPPIITIIDINKTDAGNVDKRVYAGPNPVVYYQLNNAGHPAPSLSVFTPTSRVQGAQNRDIEFAVEAWQFFRGFL